MLVNDIMAAATTTNNSTMDEQTSGQMVPEDDDIITDQSIEDVDEDTAVDPTSIIDDLPKGIPDGFYVIEHAAIQSTGFTQSQIENAFSQEDINRLKLRPDDVTVPVALKLLFPQQNMSVTKARKECRRRRILVYRGPIREEKDEGMSGLEKKMLFDREKLFVGKVADRV